MMFLGTFALALALYVITSPDGLPWNSSSHLALAYLGEIVQLPVMPHPVWGFYVQVFGGSVALSVFMAALAAGLVALIICRFFGWRFAVSAALVWTFTPWVWNRAIQGQRSVCLAAMAVVVVWIVKGVVERVWRMLHAKWLASGRGGWLWLRGLDVKNAKFAQANKIVGWATMGMAVVFALASATFHDYQLGEAASVFARGVLKDAGGRIVVMNGVADDQIVAEVHSPLLPFLSTLSSRSDDAYRTNLVAWVRREWPNETNLWTAAQVGGCVFAEAASKRFPARFYLMNGTSTTLAAWERRWETFKPYLVSSDPFVPIARHMFGYEGNAVANAMLDQPLPASSASSVAAWQLYKRIYTEIDSGNFSALVNMSEMIRRGHTVSGDEKKKVQEALENFFKDASKRERAMEIARNAGPVRADPALFTKMASEAKKRLATKIAAGEKVEFSPEVLSLVEWNNEMVRLMDGGDLVKAGRIARAILSNSKWQGFIPANAVMGSVAFQEGDYVASEKFFQVATGTTNAVPPVVLNDYADTLRQLGKLIEAEKVARRAVDATDECFWVARLTLAQVLEARVSKQTRVEVMKNGEKVEEYMRIEGAEKVEDEIAALLKVVLKNAPASVSERIRREHKEFIR